MLAPNIHKLLFSAIEARFAEDNDLMQMAKTIYRDFAPETKSEEYPFVVVSHSPEGGVTEQAAIASTGIDDAYESMPILFEVYASTCEVASQIGWQIAHAFNGFRGKFDGIDVHSAYRVQPVWSGQDEQGVCSANVLFQVSCAAYED